MKPAATMKARAAEAIAKRFIEASMSNPPTQVWPDELAEVAILALRDLTEFVTEAGTKAVLDDARTAEYAPDAESLSRQYCRDSAVAAWPAMIDAILAERNA